MTHTLVRIGSKGQMVIRQEFREKLGLHPGRYAETSLTSQGLLVKPVNVQQELAEVHKMRGYISKHWEKGLDSVRAVREDRR